MSSACTIHQLTLAELETRLAALGISVARLITAAQIGRSTWRDWRAGRTTPRPDKWASAVAAFDTLAVEARTPGFGFLVKDDAPDDAASEAPATEPVPLTGSSAPTGAPPSFAPVATAAPAGAASDNLDALIAGVLPPGDVVSQSDRARALIERDRAAWGALCDQPTTDPRFDLAARLDDARDLAVGNLTASPARTPQELAAKASVILAGLGDKPAGWEHEITPFVDLVQSTAADAVRLGAVHHGASAGPCVEARDDALPARDVLTAFSIFTDLVDEADKLEHRCSEAAERTVLTPVPEAMFRAATDGLFAIGLTERRLDGRRWYPPLALDHLRALTFEPVAFCDPRGSSRRRRDEIVAAIEDWTLRCDAACIVSGAKAAETAADNCMRHLFALRDAILDRPADGFGDVLVKMAVVSWSVVNHGESPAATFARDRANLMAKGQGQTPIALALAILVDLARMAEANGWTLGGVEPLADAGAAEAPIARAAA